MSASREIVLRDKAALAVVARNELPALFTSSPAATRRTLEFFTANIRNPNTRRAYARACGYFFRWCERRGLTLATIRPFDVAAYVEQLQRRRA